jgi:hypothetical protein
LGERIAAAERLHGAGVGSRKFFVQGGETSDEFLQILYFKILRDTVHVFFASVHPHGISAGLKGLHPDAKKVSGDLNTRQFLTAGILQLVDVLHQGFYRLLLFFGGLSVPRTAANNFRGTVKGSNVELLEVDIFISDIQPPLPPSLDGVGEFDVKVIRVGADTDHNTTYVVGDIARAVAAEVEDALPQAPVRMGPEEAFAESDKDGDVENGVGSQPMKLNPLDEKETAKEIMDGGRDAADEVVSEGYPIIDGWPREARIAGENHGFLLNPQPQRLQQLLFLFGDLGALPAADFSWFHGDVAFGGGVAS